MKDKTYTAEIVGLCVQCVSYFMKVTSNCESRCAICQMTPRLECLELWLPACVRSLPHAACSWLLLSMCLFTIDDTGCPTSQSVSPSKTPSGSEQSAHGSPLLPERKTKVKRVRVMGECSGEPRSTQRYKRELRSAMKARGKEEYCDTDTKKNENDFFFYSEKADWESTPFHITLTLGLNYYDLILYENYLIYVLILHYIFFFFFFYIWIPIDQSTITVYALRSLCKLPGNTDQEIAACQRGEY